MQVVFLREDMEGLWGVSDTGGIQDFGQGASGVLTPKRPWAQKNPQNRWFCLKIAWKLHDFE